jgi:carbamate kinase
MTERSSPRQRISQVIEHLDVIALGGNALLPSGKTGTIREQLAVTRKAMEQTAALLAAGRRIVITHGNGPVVGNIVIRNEAAARSIPPMPLDVCGADSQGGIGYMVEQSLRNALRDRGDATEVAAIVTQVVVSEHDPAFQKPVKPIGPFYTKADAARLSRERGWTIVEDSRRGYRRVVPSPYPVEIVEANVIRHLVEAGTIVIAAGGGGVPVVRVGGRLEGREAVIDKDPTSALLGNVLGAERLIILTDTEAVFRDFGTPQAAPIRRASLAEVRTQIEEGRFPEGSMGPKLGAVVTFLEGGGEVAVVCRPEHLVDALRGSHGTTIYR